jgi:hypothetical protein
MKRAASIALMAFGLAIPASASGDTPPPGATARCNDGTYSDSQTHSGTCSHHRGVAQWLTPSTPTTSPTTPPATPPVTIPPGATAAAPTSPSGGSIDVGNTILLAPRTRTAACKLGANLDRRCSPGAYYSKLTTSVICASTFRTGPIRNVPESEKHAVEIEYELTPRGYGSTLEIDHIVSLELGGSNDIANLYPEKATLAGHAPGFHVKDRLEDKLHDIVCDGTMTLRSVQRQIAANWQALYKKVLGVAPRKKLGGRARGRTSAAPRRDEVCGETRVRFGLMCDAAE